MTEGFRLLCAECGEPLFADDHLVPPRTAVYAIDFRQTAYQCNCGFIGTPVVQEVPHNTEAE